MKMFSDCSGPCKTCKIYWMSCACLAGHGDDDYEHASEEWIAEYKAKKEKECSKQQ